MDENFNPADGQGSSAEPALLPIQLAGQVPTITSLDFAAGLGIQHKNLLETVRTHQAAIEENFGEITFETRKADSAFETRNLPSAPAKQSTKPFTVALLTEDQALFVGTLGRNSKRVVEFKAVLVQSFADARKRLAAPLTALAPAVDQTLLAVLAQQTQLLSDSQTLLSQLRADVDGILAGRKPPRTERGRAGQQLDLPGLPSGPTVAPHLRGSLSLRQSINRRVITYAERWQASPADVYRYLYKRMFEVYGVHVHRLILRAGETILDGIERYGHLGGLDSIIAEELDSRLE